ncbi:recombinase family protein [Aeromonas veronii]
MKAWLYARFSSSQQADGDSINRQVKAAQQWCGTNGVELQETSFRDLGVSGWKSIKRPMFEQLIKAMSEGKIPRGSYVLFESTDRLRAANKTVQQSAGR